MRHGFKYLIISIVLTFFVVIPTAAKDPQVKSRPTDELFSKYSGKKGFTNISYSGEMLSMMTMHVSGDDISDLIGSIRLIRVLVAGDSVSGLDDISFAKDVTALAKTCTQVSTVKEAGKNILFYYAQAKDGDSELVMVSVAPGKISVLDILGNFSVKDISRLSSVAGSGKK